MFEEKYVDAWLNISWKTQEQYWNQIPPSFPVLFPSLPCGWQEFRLLRLMTWNSWNPGFRQCAHFKRGSANSNLFLERRHAHMFYFTTHFALLEHQSHTEERLVNPTSSANPWSVSFTTRKRAEKKKRIKTFPPPPFLCFRLTPRVLLLSPRCVSHTLISCLSVVLFTRNRAWTFLLTDESLLSSWCWIPVEKYFFSRRRDFSVVFNKTGLRLEKECKESSYLLATGRQGFSLIFWFGLFHIVRFFLQLQGYNIKILYSVTLWSFPQCLLKFL